MKNIRTPVSKLDSYREKMAEIKRLEKERMEIKEEFHAELVPGQIVIGRYSVKTEEHERTRLMSVNEARVALDQAGFSAQQIAKILSTIQVTGTARQFLVNYIPK